MKTDDADRFMIKELLTISRKAYLDKDDADALYQIADRMERMRVIVKAYEDRASRAAKRRLEE